MIKKLVCIYTCEADKDDMLFIENTDWYHDTMRSSDSKIIKVLASPEVSTPKLEGNTLWVNAPESYSTLSLKTYAMISACVELLDFQYLIKVDSSLTRYKPKSHRQALTFENFIKSFYEEDFYQEYNGLFKVEGSVENLTEWAELYKLDNFNLNKLYDSNIPSWFCGKCYVINRSLAEFIKAKGKGYSEDYANFLGGSEDILVGKMYSIYKKFKEGYKLGSYAKEYESRFKSLKYSHIKLLELGVQDGWSMHYWKKLFPKGEIYGIDIEECKEIPGVKIFKGEQQDFNFLRKVGEEIGELDIIIDDASHIGEYTRDSFWYLFDNYLKDGGIYVIEDWGTGYWDSWPDGAAYTGGGHTAGMVGLAKELLDECARDDITKTGANNPSHSTSKFEKMVVKCGQLIVYKK